MMPVEGSSRSMLSYGHEIATLRLADPPSRAFAAATMVFIIFPALGE